MAESQEGQGLNIEQTLGKTEEFVNKNKKSLIQLVNKELKNHLTGATTHLTLLHQTPLRSTELVKH